MNEIPRELKLYAKRLFRRGYGMRVVADQVGIAKHTAMKIRQEMGFLSCPCGQSSTHRGWCQWRFRQSAKRQALLKRLGYYNGPIRAGVFDGRRVDGSKQHLCACGCGRWTRNGYKFVKGHKPEEIWLKQAKANLAEVKHWLKENNRSPWLSPQTVSKQGRISPTL